MIIMEEKKEMTVEEILKEYEKGKEFEISDGKIKEDD